MVQNEYSVSSDMFVHNGMVMPMPILNVRDGYVYPSEKRGETEEHIAGALKKYGIDVVAGPEDSKPESADIIIRYVDKWKWDLAWYLTYLRITFHDSKTGAELVSGEFINSEVHSFQNPGREVPKIIERIMGKGL